VFALRPQPEKNTGGRPAGPSPPLAASRVSCGPAIAYMPEMPLARKFAGLLGTAVDGWVAHDDATLGAALSCYTVLSMAPLVVLAVSVAGLAFGEATARGQIVYQVQGAVGPDVAHLVEGVLVNARRPSANIVAGSLALITLLFGASGVFVALRSSLHRIWEVKAGQTSGIAAFVKDRLLAFAMVLGAGFLLLASLMASAVLAAASGFVPEWLPGRAGTLALSDVAASLAGTTALIALIFRFVSDARMNWRDIGVGAFVTAILFTIGKQLIGVYLGRAGPGSPYGAAGSLVVLLAWIYYSAQVFLFGAEFTNVYAKHKGRKIPPPWHEASEAAEEPAPGFAGSPSFWAGAGGLLSGGATSNSADRSRVPEASRRDKPRAR
jgi:membrane protein